MDEPLTPLQELWATMATIAGFATFFPPLVATASAESSYAIGSAMGAVGQATEWLADLCGIPSDLVPTPSAAAEQRHSLSAASVPPLEAIEVTLRWLSSRITELQRTLRKCDDVPLNLAYDIGEAAGLLQGALWLIQRDIRTGQPH